MISTYPDLDPNFLIISEDQSVLECAVRACEEVLFDRADDKLDEELEARKCVSEIEKDERVKQAIVTLSGSAIYIEIEPTTGEDLRLQGFLDDEKLAIIFEET